MRKATQPSARLSLCRLRTGYSATAVPMPPMPVRISATAPSCTLVSPLPPMMKRVSLSTESYSGSAAMETKDR